MMFTPLHVDYTTYQRETRSADSDDRWDRGDTDTSYTIKGLRLGDDYPSVNSQSTVNPGDVVWLVWAEYSTGDSFGHDYNGSIDFISVHTNKEIAQRNVEILNAAESNADLVIHLDNGDTMSYYAPWFGYFESLNTVRCERFVVRR